MSDSHELDDLEAAIERLRAVVIYAKGIPVYTCSVPLNVDWQDIATVLDWIDGKLNTVTPPANR